MLRYVTKSNYWSILDKGIMDKMPGTGHWHLKDIQDAIAYSYLYDKVGLDIAEIGAGQPRMLGKLAECNRCYAIDEYKGNGNGPKSRPNINNVSFIDVNIGESEGVIADKSYDIIFSVSVVEHVPDKKIHIFFEDCWRILRPGGMMIHLIDVYCETVEGNNLSLFDRVQHYINSIENSRFDLFGAIEINTIDDLAFKSSFATNPDDMMFRWNKSSPGLIEKRKYSQSCALEMVAYRANN